MIKFFRKIRQKLLTENKFSKYLLYAIGEIVLVVIGILIALQINNWNEERKKLETENSLIKSLNQEFKNNLNNLDSTISLIDVVTDSTSKLLISFSNSQALRVKGEDLDKLLSVCTSSPIWKRSENSLREIENSGSLNGIGHENIKTLIYNWLGEIESLKSFEERSRESIKEYMDYITEFGSWREVDKYVMVQEGGSILMPENDHLLNDSMFENIVNNHLVWLRIKKSRYINIRKQVEKIIDATNK